MSSTSARREALSATVGGLGTFGWMMTGAADILTGDVHDQWNACAGRKGVSPAPWIGRVAFVPCALAVLFALTRSWWAVRDMLASRLFSPWLDHRSVRIRSVGSFFAAWVLLGACGWALWHTSSVDLANQRCRGTLEEMQQQHQALFRGQYTVSGACGFLASAAAGAFFLVQDVRKRQKERQRRYHSSKYYESSGDDTDGDDPHARAAKVARAKARAKAKARSSSSKVVSRTTVVLTSSRNKVQPQQAPAEAHPL